MAGDKSHYVYALKDGRQNPAMIFYVGRGVGSRKDDHLIHIDNTPKGKFIREILSSGGKVIPIILCDQLTKSESIKIEAELITAFGTEKNGGILKNSVSPKGISQKISEKIKFSSSVFDKSQIGIKFLKDAIMEFIELNPGGVKNYECAHYLDLRSDHNGKQKDYLTYSILGILLKENKIFKDKDGRYKKK